MLKLAKLLEKEECSLIHGAEEIFEAYFLIDVKVSTFSGLVECLKLRMTQRSWAGAILESCERVPLS
jgi:hypothetical protein